MKKQRGTRCGCPAGILVKLVKLVALVRLVSLSDYQLADGVDALARDADEIGALRQLADIDGQAIVNNL